MAAVCLCIGQHDIVQVESGRLLKTLDYREAYHLILFNSRMYNMSYTPFAFIQFRFQLITNWVFYLCKL